MAYHHTKFLTCARCGKITVEGTGKCYHCGAPVGGKPPVVEQERRRVLDREKTVYMPAEPVWESGRVKVEPPSVDVKAEAKYAEPERPVSSPFDVSVKKPKKKGGIKKIALCLAAIFVVIGGFGMLAGDSDGETPTTPELVPEAAKPVDLGNSTISETVVLEWEGVKVTAKSIDHEGIFGPEIKLLIENDSPYNYIVQADHAVANSYMIASSMSEEVAAGKKANTGLTLMESDLEEADVGKFTELAFDLHLLDPDSFQTVYESELITLHTNYYGTYEQAYKDEGTVIYNDGSVSVVVQNLEEDSLFGPELMMYAENMTDETVIIQTEDFSVNGFMVTDLFSATLLPDTRYVGGVTLFESEMEENDISSVENVEFILKLIDPDTFMTISATEPIALDFVEGVVTGENGSTTSKSEGEMNSAVSSVPVVQPETEPVTSSAVSSNVTMTMGQRNALGAAKSYLSYSAFSYSGLVEQLEFEGYSRDDAAYAADNCGADWDEQATRSAKSYLNYSAFSHAGLIEQLEFEGFTSSQAKYGADNCGADWMEQAVKCAKNYLQYTSFSKSGLIEQLEFEGFTNSQAVYGVEQNGY